MDHFEERLKWVEEVGAVCGCDLPALRQTTVPRLKHTTPQNVDACVAKISKISTRM